MRMMKKADGQRTLHLTNRELEVMRLLIRMGSVSLAADQDIDRVTKVIAEHIVQKIMQDSVSETEGG